VAVWDLGWSGGSDLDEMSDVRDAGVPVVALVPEAARGTEVWAAGARGMVPRSVDAPTLMAALRAVAAGLTVFSSEVVGPQPPVRARPSQELAEDLTPREHEVLQLLAEGLPNKAIARKLGISEHTVKFHINAILGKLGAGSRTEAVVLATRLGLVLL
jgi:DNA-binding NarL/FixJ family response regulator